MHQSLSELFESHSGRPAHKWLHYFPVYERFLSPYRGKPITLLEIGCGKGGSLQLWKKYLGKDAKIVGIDIDASAKEFAEEQISVRIGNQSDTSFLQDIVDEFGIFDFVIDDGSHVMQDVEASFLFLYLKISESGVYLIEDMSTAYWPGFGGGLLRKGTFIETSKHLIDHLNAEYIYDHDFKSDFHAVTTGIHFYNSMIVFEKGRVEPALDREISATSRIDGQVTRWMEQYFMQMRSNRSG